MSPFPALILIAMIVILAQMVQDRITCERLTGHFPRRAKYLGDGHGYALFCENCGAPCEGES